MRTYTVNPAKYNLGRISSQLLNETNMTIRKKSDLQQWRKTAAVISWFKNFPYSEGSRFFTFDIVNFYPSITRNCLKILSLLLSSGWKSTMKPVHLLNTAENPFCSAETVLGSIKVAHFLM